jgi:hypothetical protein
MQAACSFPFLLFDLINLITFSKTYNLQPSLSRNFLQPLSLPNCHVHSTSYSQIYVFYLSDWTEHFGIYIIIENQQMHQNDHFIVMLSQTLLSVSAYQRHNKKAHMILTSYLYVIVHYRRNNGISSEVAPIGIVTLCT